MLMAGVLSLDSCGSTVNGECDCSRRLFLVWRGTAQLLLKKAGQLSAQCLAAQLCLGGFIQLLSGLRRSGQVTHFIAGWLMVPTGACQVLAQGSAALCRTNLLPVPEALWQ